jgi:hypothetical protein
MTNYVREYELTELRDDLDKVVDIIDETRDGDGDRPRDALSWATAIVMKAADFVADHLDRIKRGAE